LDLEIYSLSLPVCPGADTLKACRLGLFLFSLNLVRFVCLLQDYYGRVTFFLSRPLVLGRSGPPLDFVNDADNGPLLIPDPTLARGKFPFLKRSIR